MNRLLILLTLAAALILAPAANAQLPGAFTSPGVEFVKNIPSTFDTSGAVLYEGYYYITTERDLTIYDVKDAENPVQVGHYLYSDPGTPIFSEEDVNTNGKILPVWNTNGLMIIDVSDKANPTLLSTMADTSDQHTVSCILDCTWLYGSEGAIVDLRDPKNPKLSKNTWDKGTLSSYHDVTEVKPGIVLTSSQPMILLDARTDPENPTLIDSTEMPGFTHANLWPHLATDQFALVGGESTGPGCSNDASATFQTWDTTGYEGGKPFKLLSQFAMSTGAPTSGQSPETTYCVHWFQPHPTYANGGLLSIAWYEHGVRLLQISGEGKISEIGWYVPIAGQSSDVDWINDKVIYVADYLRGLDILRYTGPVPQGRGNTSMTPVTPGAPPAMGGGSPSPAGTTPVVAGQSFSAYVTLPRAGRCVKAKTFRIKVRKTKDPVTSLTISINAKKALTVKGKKLKKPITLKKLPRKKAFTLQVVLKTKAGHTSGDQHSYRGC